MITSENRILTTHTGSLPRPAALVDFFGRRRRGEAFDNAEFARVAADALKLVIAKQAEAGIDIGNNGEQIRDGFFRYVKDRMVGFDGTWARPPKTDIDRFPAFKAMRSRAAANRPAADRALTPAATGDIRYLDPNIIRDECEEVSAAVKAAGSPFVEVFMNAPSPGIVATALGNLHYESQEAYIAAIGTALKVEYEAIVDQGFVLQIDAPDLALEAGVAFAGKPISEFLEFVELTVATINNALVNIPRDRVRMHVCWGNSETPHDQDIPLVDIMPILKKAKVGGYVLPFANPAHAHEFHVLGELPMDDDQVIVAGVIDTVTNVLEHPEVIADRLERVAAVVGDPRRVIAGTDCGFETVPGMSAVAEDVAWAKLARLTEGARLASKHLFPARRRA